MNNIILIGMKGCGKSTVGKLLAKKLRVNFIDSDREIEKVHAKKKKEILSVREIFKKYGHQYFEKLDIVSLKKIVKKYRFKNFVLACAGRTPLNIQSQKILKKMGTIIFLNTDKEILLPRIIRDVIPPFFPFPNDTNKSLKILMEIRFPIYHNIADITLGIGKQSPDEIVQIIKLKL